MDLVIGATGLVGQQIALGLSRQGRAVRAVVRGGPRHEKAAPLVSAGVEVVDADLTKPATLPGACAGVETVLCTATSMPHGKDDGLRRVDHEGTLALIGCAERAGARHFVYTSYSGNIRVDSPLETAKRACENRLLSGKMRVTILRPSYFSEVWLSPALGFAPASGRVRIYGSGDAKVSYISLNDVAAFAVAAAAQPANSNAVLEMGGPEPLSQLDVLGIFERAQGQKMEVDRVPLAALEEQHRSATDPLQKTFAALMIAYAKGDEIPGSRETARRYGVTLHSVEEYCASTRKAASA
ncbi:MAG TPA: NmrA family NAD(P)-binding protein [Candidatus Angelobacter sp.]|nr:NmrA family NAD(P)-binding protein [Candidatus Angelobacter sp.]